MSRPKNDEAPILSSTSEEGQPSEGAWELRVPGTQEIIDCSEFKEWGELGIAAIRVKRRRAAAFSSMIAAREQIREIFRLIAKFCDVTNLPRPTSVAELSEAIISGTLGLIATKESWSADTRADYGAEASSLFRKLVKTDVSVPQVQGVRRRMAIVKTVSATDADAIYAAAKADIFKIRDRIVAGEAMFSTAKVPTHPDWQSSKEGMIAYWMSKLAGLPQSAVSLAETEEGQFLHTQILSLKFRIAEMNRILYPGLADAVPFILFLTKKYGLNVRGVLDLKIDSLINDTLIVVKKRGDGSDKYVVLSEEDLVEVREILGIWLSITKRGRALLKHEDQKWLWAILISRDTKNGLIRPWHYHKGGRRMLLRVLRDWCDGRGIARSVGSALMGKLRKHAGSVVYKAAAAAAGSIEEQVNAIREVVYFLQHKWEMPPCYSLALITDDEVALAINESHRRIEMKLLAYGVNSR